MTAAAKGSTGAPMIFTQSEATAAQRTWMFHLVLVVDQTNAIAIVPVVTISKAGAAFAGAAGAVTEIGLGWYKFVFAAADLDTLGCLAVNVTGTGADAIMTSHQVTLLDLNVATVAPPTDGITAGTIAASAIGSSEIADGALTAAKFGSDALAAISAAIDTRRKTASIAANGVSAIGMRNAIKADIDVTGTWGGGSAQMQTCEDATAAVPVWTNNGVALTANGRVTVAGPHAAVRVNLTGATAPALAVVFTLSNPAT
jgi:hypothetical protein